MRNFKIIPNIMLYSARQFSSFSLNKVAPRPYTTPVFDLTTLKIDFSRNLSESLVGHEMLQHASHKVFYATAKNNSRMAYAVKFLSQALVNENDIVTRTEEEALAEGVFEALAMQIGGVLCPGQFTNARLARYQGVVPGIMCPPGYNHVCIVNNFIENGITVDDVHNQHDVEGGDYTADDNIFYLDKAADGIKRTKVHITKDSVAEKIRLSGKLRHTIAENSKYQEYSIKDAFVWGRIEMILADYILGNIEPAQNKYRNVFLVVTNFFVDEANKAITPEITPVIFDAGLCLRSGLKITDKLSSTVKLALRAHGSHYNEFAVDGDHPTSLRDRKNNFIIDLVDQDKLSLTNQYVNWARPYLNTEQMQGIHDMLSRFEIAANAGKLVKAGYIELSQANEARIYLEQEVLQSKTETGWPNL